MPTEAPSIAAPVVLRMRIGAYVESFNATAWLDELAAAVSAELGALIPATRFTYRRIAGGSIVAELNVWNVADAAQPSADAVARAAANDVDPDTSRLRQLANGDVLGAELLSFEGTKPSWYIPTKLPGSRM